MHLALYCFANSQLSTALNLLYRARYLMLLVFGEDHPEMALLDVSNLVVSSSFYSPKNLLPFKMPIVLLFKNNIEALIFFFPPPGLLPVGAIRRGKRSLTV